MLDTHQPFTSIIRTSLLFVIVFAQRQVDSKYRFSSLISHTGRLL